MDNATLIAGGMEKINRLILSQLPVPAATSTHKPIGHHTIVEALVETLGFRKIGVVSEEYAVSPDGMKIVSGSQGKIIHVWDMPAGANISKMTGHDGSVGSVIFSPDGTRVISGSYDNTIRVWDWVTASLTLELRGHGGPVMAINYSPDGTKLVSGSNDTTIRVWDIKTGAFIIQLRGHEDGVNSVTFSPDGTRIVSSSDDFTIRVWDVASGLEVLPPLQENNDWVMSVVLSHDGTKVISGSREGLIQVIQVRLQSLGREVSRKDLRLFKLDLFLANGQLTHSRQMLAWNPQKACNRVLFSGFMSS